jgi:hypothetical protein
VKVRQVVVVVLNTLDHIPMPETVSTAGAGNQLASVGEWVASGRSQDSNLPDTRAPGGAHDADSHQVLASNLAGLHAEVGAGAVFNLATVMDGVSA